MALAVRPCRSEDVPGVVDFFRRVWTPEHVFVRDPEFMRWQIDPARNLKMNCSGFSSLVLEDGDRIAGFLGLTPCRFNLNGRVLDSYWMCNFSVDADVRAAGGAPQLLLAALRLPVNVIAAAGIRDDIVYFFRSMGYRIIERVPRWIRLLDRDACAALAGGEDGLPAALPVRGRAQSGIRVEAADFSGDAVEWDRFWAEYAALGYAGVERDSGYMTWRYARHPRFGYVSVVAKGAANGNVRGYAVYRLEPVRGAPQSVMRLIELAGTSEEAGAALLNHVEAEARSRGAAFIDHYNTRADGALRDAPGWFEEETLGDAVVPALFQPLYRGPHKINAIVRFLDRTPDWNGALESVLSIVKSDGDQDRFN